MSNKRTDKPGSGKDTRFQPGQSGNPEGRRKGSKNKPSEIDDELSKELGDQVQVTENGRRRWISKGQAMVKQLVNQAAGGDIKAMQAILRTMLGRQKKTPPQPAATGLSAPDDRLVFADIVRRIRETADTKQTANSPIENDEDSNTGKEDNS